MSSLLSVTILDSLLQEPGVRSLWLKRRTVVYRQGTPATELYIVDSGVIGLRRSRNEKHTIARILGPGSIFGFYSAICETAQTADAIALNESRLWCIPKDPFLNFCEQRSNIWHLLMRQCATENEECVTRMELLCLSDVRTRIEHYLQELVKLSRDRDGDGYVAHITQLELAELIGATRETTSTILNELAREGKLSLGHKSILVRPLSEPSQARALTMAAGSQ